MSLEGRDRWFYDGRPSAEPLVLIATERELPEPDPDEELLLHALNAAGIAARFAAWDDTAIRWDHARLAVIRSTWSYYRQRERFVEWAEATGKVTRLYNPASVVRWNSHKRYLLELQAAGVPVVPTILLERGSAAGLRDILAGRGWSSAIAKPAVSASSYGTLLVGGTNFAEGERHLSELLRNGDALVQPYIESVEGHGERAVIWIDGQFTHEVRKSRRLAGDEESVSEALPIAVDELEVATAALTVIREPLLYARVDLARDAEGRPLVMEMELIEPSLYLLQSPAALERLVRAVAARA